MANINLVSYGAENTAFLIADFFTAPNGSVDSVPTLTQANGNPVSAALEVQSKLGGILIPRMTTTQRNALNAVNGLMIYNATTNTFDIYQGGAWATIGDSKLDSSVKFILATATAGFINSQSLGSLTTGILKDSVLLSTGTLSTAVAGTDYYSPGNPTTLTTNAANKHNIFVGTLCGNTSGTGGSNTGFGVNCLTGLVNDSSITCVGFQAGVNLASSHANIVYIGSGTTANANTSVFIGYQSGSSVGSPDINNVGIGYQTFVNASVDAFISTAVGADAASTQTNYSQSVFIGNGADASANGLNNAIAIGNNAVVAATNSMVLGNGSVNVGIGTSSPSEFMHVSGGNARIDSANALKLYNAGNTHFSALKSANVGSDITWTLPQTDNALPLYSNGSGTLSFSTPTVGPVSGLSAFSGEVVNYASTYTTGTASQSTTTITGSGTTFTAAMVGGLIVFANASYGFITAFGSTTSLTVDTSQTVTGQAYTIYYNGLISDNHGNAGANNLYFSGNGISSYVPAPLNYYENVTLNASWTGPVTVTNQNVYLTRIGNVVKMRIQCVQDVAATATAPWVFGATIPARFIPATPIGDLYVVYNSVSSGTNLVSIMVINFVTSAIGTITAYTGNTGLNSFVNGDNPIQLDQSGISWTLA